MATHWTDRRTAVAMIGQQLAKRGAKLWGWKADKSDMMTDYFDPESWDGVAEMHGAIICVDVAAHDVERNSGKLPTRHVTRDLGTCERCAGTGEEPGGWTLAQARAKPREYHLHDLLTDHPGAVALPDTGGPMGVGVRLADGCTLRPMSADVVSPLGFLDSGAEACSGCGGKGNRTAFETEPAPEAERWPVFQANPPGRLWHVERSGRIVASGVGVFAVAAERYRDEKPKLLALCDRIEAAALGPVRPEHDGQPEANGAAVTIRPGKREGYSEVVFASKPADGVRAALKAAGYRWAKSGGCWYGRTDSMPASLIEAAKGVTPC